MRSRRWGTCSSISPRSRSEERRRSCDCRRVTPRRGIRGRTAWGAATDITGAVSPLERAGAAVLDDTVALGRLRAGAHHDEIATDFRTGKPVRQVNLARFDPAGLQVHRETKSVIIKQDGL